MQTSNRVFPRQNFPDVSVKLINGQRWSLSEQTNQNFSMLVFYRGLHCPICAKYLADLDRRVEKFRQLGVGVVAISSDTQQRATQTQKDWKLENLDLGYGFELQTAREIGLYISAGHGKTSIGIEEPDKFIEPALFVVRPDQTLYFSSVQTMPFARPNFAEVASALEFVINNDYPARGEVVDI